MNFSDSHSTFVVMIHCMGEYTVDIQSLKISMRLLVSSGSETIVHAYNTSKNVQIEKR